MEGTEDQQLEEDMFRMGQSEPSEGESEAAGRTECCSSRQGVGSKPKLTGIRVWGTAGRQVMLRRLRRGGPEHHLGARGPRSGLLPVSP